MNSEKQNGDIRYYGATAARATWKTDDGAEFKTREEAEAYASAEFEKGRDLGATGPRDACGAYWRAFDPLGGVGSPALASRADAEAWLDRRRKDPRPITFSCLFTHPFYRGVAAWVSPARGGKWRAGIGVASSYVSVGAFGDQRSAEAAAMAAAESVQSDAIAAERKRIIAAGCTVGEISRSQITLRVRDTGDTPGWGALT